MHIRLGFKITSQIMFLAYKSISVITKLLTHINIYTAEIVGPEYTYLLHLLLLISDYDVN